MNQNFYKYKRMNKKFSCKYKVTSLTSIKFIEIDQLHINEGYLKKNYRTKSLQLLIKFGRNKALLYFCLLIFPYLKWVMRMQHLEASQK